MFLTETRFPLLSARVLNQIGRIPLLGAVDEAISNSVSEVLGNSWMEIWESISQQLALKPGIIFLPYKVLCFYYFILIFC